MSSMTAHFLYILCPFQITYITGIRTTSLRAIPAVTAVVSQTSEHRHSLEFGTVPKLKFAKLSNVGEGLAETTRDEDLASK